MSRPPVPRSPLPNPRPSPAAIVAALVISGPGVAIAVAGRPAAAAAGAAVTLVLAQLALAFSREVPTAHPRRHRGDSGGRRRRPVHPPMDGLHLDGMHVLKTMGDAFALQHVLAAGGARSALVVERHLRLLDEWEASSGCWLGQVSSSWPIARAGAHGGWWRPAAGSASTASRRGARLGTAAVVPRVIRVRSRVEVVPVRPAEKLRQADKL
jgi:hypothetical protein